MEYIKTILTTIGGVTLILTFVFTFLKGIGEKYIDSLIKKSANKELEKAKNKMARSMSAYELLLNKEFEYYQKIDNIYASLIVDIQDVYWYMVEARNLEFEQRCNKLKEISIRIVKIVPELKNFNLMYQCYIPLDVFKGTGYVIGCLQDGLEKLVSNIELFYDNMDIDKEELLEYEDNVLMSIAWANNKIKDRLSNLSS